MPEKLTDIFKPTQGGTNAKSHVSRGDLLPPRLRAELGTQSQAPSEVPVLRVPRLGQGADAMTYITCKWNWCRRQFRGTTSETECPECRRMERQ